MIALGSTQRFWLGALLTPFTIVGAVKLWKKIQDNVELAQARRDGYDAVLKLHPEFMKNAKRILDRAGFSYFPLSRALVFRGSNELLYAILTLYRYGGMQFQPLFREREPDAERWGALGGIHPKYLKNVTNPELLRQAREIQ